MGSAIVRKASQNLDNKVKMGSDKTETNKITFTSLINKVKTY